VALLTAVLAAGPVSTADAAVPTGLSVSIQNDHAEVHSGDRVVYTATLRNDGTNAVDGRLVITVPAFIHVTGAEGADRTGLDASWTVTVPAGERVTKKLTGTLDDIPKGQVRVTTLVGLYLGDAAQPVIRSADAAAIAGVKDPAHAVNDQAPRTDAPAASWIWVGLGIAAVVLLAAIAAGWLVWRRGRRVVAQG
jgi:hypothetical protein